MNWTPKAVEVAPSNAEAKRLRKAAKKAAKESGNSPKGHLRWVTRKWRTVLNGWKRFSTVGNGFPRCEAFYTSFKNPH